MAIQHTPELSEGMQIPFALGRHGQSVFNAETLCQGRGEDEPGKPNGLTDLGVRQVRDAAGAFAAAGLRVDYVSSSDLRRARESADVFTAASDPPPRQLDPVIHITEVSQRGWERVHAREQVKAFRKDAVRAAQSALSFFGLRQELREFVPWTVQYGRGESPLEAALRGAGALGIYQPRPHELVIAHAMLNRYVGALATRTTASDRQRLNDMLVDRSPVVRVELIKALSDLGVPDFTIADDARNRQANGGATEYTIDPQTGLWTAHRRIEPPKPQDTQPFREYALTPQGLWERRN